MRNYLALITILFFSWSCSTIKEVDKYRTENINRVTITGPMFLQSFLYKTFGVKNYVFDTVTRSNSSDGDILLSTKFANSLNISINEDIDFTTMVSKLSILGLAPIKPANFEYLSYSMEQKVIYLVGTQIKYKITKEGLIQNAFFINSNKQEIPIKFGNSEPYFFNLLNEINNQYEIYHSGELVGYFYKENESDTAYLILLEQENTTLESILDSYSIHALMNIFALLDNSRKDNDFNKEDYKILQEGLVLYKIALNKQIDFSNITNSDSIPAKRYLKSGISEYFLPNYEF